MAAFSPDEAEHEWGREHLEPWGVRLYNDYNKMLEHEGLEGVVIATSTSVHADMAIQAMERGKHVLCEKPLSTDVEVVSRLSHIESRGVQRHMSLLSFFDCSTNTLPSLLPSSPPRKAARISK